MEPPLMKVIKFASEEFTPFAPYWDYVMAETEVQWDLQPLIDEILSKEKGIIESTEFTDDWGTRLGKNSLTSRSNTYNLLEFDNAADLRDSIRSVHDRFLQNLEMEYPSGIFVQCWANVMRKKEKIAPHCHAFGPYTYLSGHLCMQVEDTSTYYINPYGGDPWESENTNGKITLFPGWLRHYTDPVPPDQTRITIAFDILSENGYYEDVKDDMKHHWIRL